ncbi:MAG: hypothetical protein Q8M15_04265 [Bacteroidota bacterium]|nr:hypothetical protein [Bacteroidota bacterium]
MKKYIHILVFAFILSLQSLPVCAQPDFEDEVEDAPLDGGVAILVVAGVIYGVRIRGRNNKEF